MIHNIKIFHLLVSYKDYVDVGCNDIAKLSHCTFDSIQGKFMRKSSYDSRSVGRVLEKMTMFCSSEEPYNLHQFKKLQTASESKNLK